MLTYAKRVINFHLIEDVGFSLRVNLSPNLIIDGKFTIPSINFVLSQKLVKLDFPTVDLNLIFVYDVIQLILVYSIISYFMVLFTDKNCKTFFI